MANSFELLNTLRDLRTHSHDDLPASHANVKEPEAARVRVVENPLGNFGPAS
jgi:hypothetical protein